MFEPNAARDEGYAPPQPADTTKDREGPPCAVCGTIRFVLAPATNQLLPCTACNVVHKRRHQRLLARFAMGDARVAQQVAAWSFASFDAELRDHTLQPVEWYKRIYDAPAQRQYLRKACMLAQRYAASPDGWFFVCGPPGAGKTHLCVAIANERLTRGDMVVYASVTHILDVLKTAFSHADADGDELLAQLKTVDVLLLDDLGAETGSGFNEEKIFTILNERALRRLPTIISANAPPEVFVARVPRIGRRIVDQVIPPNAVVLPVDDYSRRSYEAQVVAVRRTRGT